MVRPRQITQFISPPKEVGVSMVRPLRFTQDIFTDRALDDIYKESTGIPRRIGVPKGSDHRKLKTYQRKMPPFI